MIKLFAEPLIVYGFGDWKLNLELTNSFWCKVIRFGDWKLSCLVYILINLVF